MIPNNVEELVRRYVNFSHGVSGQGWNTVFCEYCGDGSRKKGPRGGWSFTDGGDTGFYHCFNCGCNENFSTNRDQPFSKNMRKVFDSFGIPDSEYNSLLLSKKVTNKKNAKSPADRIIHTFIDTPDHFALLTEISTDKSKEAKNFLKRSYDLRVSDYAFLYGTGATKSTLPMDIANAKSFYGRIIIPCYKNGKMIYYQGRDVTGKSKVKYLSPSIPKNSVLFNLDLLYLATDDPLYVVESAFDAIHLSGVATLGNELSKIQIELLKSSKRRKILVPDFNGDSNKLIEQFIKNDWDVAFPEYRSRFKDVSEAVVNYGKIYTAYDITTNIKTSNEANIMLQFMR